MRWMIEGSVEVRAWAGDRIGPGVAIRAEQVLLSSGSAPQADFEASCVPI